MPCIWRHEREDQHRKGADWWACNTPGERSAADDAQPADECVQQVPHQILVQRQHVLQRHGADVEESSVQITLLGLRAAVIQRPDALAVRLAGKLVPRDPEVARHHQQDRQERKGDDGERDALTTRARSAVTCALDCVKGQAAFGRP